jgi:hypothetical protein
MRARWGWWRFRGAADVPGVIGETAALTGRPFGGNLVLAWDRRRAHVARAGRVRIATSVTMSASTVAAAPMVSAASTPEVSA